MKKNILLRTNMLICVVVVIGFLLIFVIGYHGNYRTALNNIEQVSRLTSEGIYHQLNSIISRPVDVSQALADDNLLKELLLDEPQVSSDTGFTKAIMNYLSAYQKKYDYVTVFLVSKKSGKYYNVNGLDRVIKKRAPENEWYFNIMESQQDYSVIVDKDEAAGVKNCPTVFVNCKIKNNAGEVIGVVGAGFWTAHIQKLLKDCRNQFGVESYLINQDGTIEISADHTGLEGINLFKAGGDGDNIKGNVLSRKKESKAYSFWADNGKENKKRSFIVTRYLPELQWHLVSERDVSKPVERMNWQLAATLAITALIIAIILIIVSRVIHGFNQCLIQLPQSIEAERRCVFEKATEQLFEKVYELDITNNRAANKATEDYFIRLGASKGMPYDESLKIAVQKEIKEEFREGYLNTFCPENVLRVFEEGQDILRYEFMILNDSGNYYWLRIIACIVRWQSDKSIHMLIYRQNIDAEKRQEYKLRELALRDEMTGLLTKSAFEHQIRQKLQNDSGNIYAFFIIDIDYFKDANDIYGHAFGDSVIRVVASAIRSLFRKEDLIGRLGGDEFVAFIQVEEKAWAEKKAAEMLKKLDKDHFIGDKKWRITVSIGVAAASGCDFETFYKYADEALYQSKKSGRNRCTVYQEK